MANKKDIEKTAEILRLVHDPHMRAVLAVEFVEYFKKESAIFNEDKFLRSTHRKSDFLHVCHHCDENPSVRNIIHNNGVNAKYE